jgi:hypothetical protein
MNIRFGRILALLLLLGVSLFAMECGGLVSGQEKDKTKDNNQIKALFNGIPADLRSKVKNNPVRRDRVNDWLKEQVDGKAKAIEIQIGVRDVQATRSSDGTYVVRLELREAIVNVLEDDWQLYLSESGKGEGNVFSFMGVSSTDAEKLADLKKVVLKGKLKVAILLSNAPRTAGGPPVIFIVLEDVQVDGKKWRPFKAAEKGKSGKGQKMP